jgi:hypothetical protein
MNQNCRTAICDGNNNSDESEEMMVTIPSSRLVVTDSSRKSQGVNQQEIAKGATKTEHRLELIPNSSGKICGPMVRLNLVGQSRPNRSI